MFELLIRQCNEFLFVHMYPGTTRLEPAQHRDLIRTFFAGALEALMAAGCDGCVNSLAPEYARMAAEDWEPDARFQPALPM